MAEIVKARRASGSMSASPAPRDKPPPRLIRQAIMNKVMVSTKHTVADESLSGLPNSQASPRGSEGPVSLSFHPAFEGSVGDWLNPPLPEQAGRQKNGLDELQHGLTNLLGNFFGLSSGSEDGVIPRSPVAFGPDSPPPVA